MNPPQIANHLKCPRARTIICCVSLLLAGMVACSLHAQTGEILLSRNKPATSLSNETASLNAPKAVDGLTSTRWASAERQDPQWLVIDLGSRQSITHVRLNWETAYGRAYQIQVSDNGNSWTSIFSTTAGNGAVDNLTGFSAMGRYVRMYGTQRGTQWGYSLWEMEVFGLAAPPEPDTAPPLVTFNSPADGDNVTAGVPVPLSMTATDNVGVVSTGFSIDGSTVTSPVTLATPGPVAITATARDAEGNAGTASVTVNVVSDTAPPQVTFTSPTDGIDVTAGKPLTLAMTATDNVAVVSSGFSIAASAVASPVTLTAPGPVTIVASAQDAAGNTGTAAVSVNVVPDTAAPDVTITSPSDGATVIAGAPVSLSMTATDNVGVTSSGFTIEGAPVTSPVTLTTLGPVTIAATARDAAGNTGSASVTITVVGGEVLLSRDKPATSSSNETSSFTAPKAVDGLTNTRWSSAFSNPQWISIDLGSPHSITHVKLTWETAYGSAYQIQVSDNGASWTSIFSTTTGNGATDDLTGLSGTGRYVRMYGTQRGTQWGYSLWEMEVYGPGGPPPPDTAPPLVTMTSPRDGDSVPAGVPLTLSMTATDNVGVVSSGFAIAGSAVTSPVTLTTLGPVTITASALDAAGNAGSASVTITVVEPPPPPPPGEGGVEMTLSTGWLLQTSSQVSQAGSVVSTASYQPQGWYPVTLPASIIAGLLQNDVYPDPFYGKNLELIDPNDFSVPWWYRGTFLLPSSENGKRVSLKLEGINYRAEVWLNGSQLAGANTVAGPYRAFEFDITSLVGYSGLNVIALKVTPPDNPVTTDLAITFNDWSPNPPDWNMGVLNDVVVSTSGPVVIRHPFVKTALDLPSLNVAHLTVIAEVTNNFNAAVAGTLDGSIGGVTFSQSVSLAAGETRQITFAPGSFSQLNISNPVLWWPWQYGAPSLQTLNLKFVAGGKVSDSVTTQFGIRQITSAISSGTRVFSVNGKPILIRGAAWNSDMFQRRSPERQEAEIRYVRDMNLNTLRSEGRFDDDHLFELTDKYGILVLIGWNCCDAWQETGSWSSAQRTIANESLRSLLYRLRNHPSMLVWLNGSDEVPVSSVEQGFLSIEASLQWPNPIIQAAIATSTTGVKMRGPYEWEPPVYWETDDDNGGAWGFATEISPGPAPPPLDSLVKFIPSGHLWPIDSFWNYHAGSDNAFVDIDVFTDALNRRYGASGSAAQYAKKAQAAAYESHRAMFEAYGRNKYTASGVIQWMLSNAWPGMIWHLYDYYLRPGGSYFGAKNGLEPLHVQYSYADRGIVVVNSTQQSYSNLLVTARVLNLDGAEKYSNSEVLGPLAADAVTTAFTIPAISGLSGTYFVRLTLTDAGALVSRQTYWLSTRADTLNWGQDEWYVTPQSQFADYTALNSLPPVNLIHSERYVDQDGRTDAFVTVTNTSSSIAFFVRLKINKGVGGEEVLPVLWQDNYVTLLPGESREIKANYAIADLGGAIPIVTVEPYNNP